MIILGIVGIRTRGQTSRLVATKRLPGYHSCTTAAGKEKKRASKRHFPSPHVPSSSLTPSRMASHDWKLWHWSQLPHPQKHTLTSRAR
ncbi:hypothetical protein JMJ77_0007054, partial [Colletotrichum scovillei]